MFEGELELVGLVLAGTTVGEYVAWVESIRLFEFAACVKPAYNCQDVGATDG